MLFAPPAIIPFARRLRTLLPIPGLVAGALYAFTLSHGFTPGLSATLTAAAAGLTPPSGASHPLFAWAARLAASTGLFSLPVRLNLFSALCGALCAMLAYHLVSRLVLFSASKFADAELRTCNGRRRSSAATDDSPPAPAVRFRDSRLLRFAAWSGLLAAFFLALSAPMWSASTRLDRGPFDLLLALLSLSLFPTARTAWRTPRLMASVALFTCGLLETPVFLFLLPCYAFVLFQVCLASHRRFAALGQLALAGLCGLAVMLIAFRLNSQGGSALSGAELLGAFASAAPYCLYREARAFFPPSGWALPLLQIGLASVIVLFGRKALFHQRGRQTMIALSLLAVAVIPGLLLLPVAPHFVFLPYDHLPVFASAVFALGAAIAFAACLIILVPGSRPQPEQEAQPGKGKASKRPQPFGRISAFAKILIAALLLAALVFPLRSIPEVRASPGAFADAVARELLATLKGRPCLVTSGLLDNHLRLQALASERPPLIISLRAREMRREQARLCDALDTDPLFKGQNRMRLQNALDINPLRFVTEWLSMDTNAYASVLVEATPDLWTACGYSAIPEGLAFSGLRLGQKPDTARLVQENREFADRIAPLLSSGEHDRPGPHDALRLSLRLRMGVAANELGVLLEELNEPEAAYQAYSDALRIDPQNVSAAINACALATAKLLHPESHDPLKKRIKSMLSDRRSASRGLAGIVQRYGTVRHPAFYQQQAQLWTAAGTPVVAAAKVRKALDLAEQAGTSSLLQKAYLHEQLGDMAKAEAGYLASLENEQTKGDALLGLCRLALASRDAERADTWLRQAVAAGADPAALLTPTIDLALLQKDLPHARTLLTAATKQQPENPRYWGQLAEVMVKQGDALLVKQALLPEMQKALKARDQYLILSIRGILLIKMGPATVKEGRLELLKSLSLNAAQPNVWNAVLAADMIINNPAFMETDARSLLALEPDHALANCLLGSVLLAKDRLPEAEDAFRRSLAREPSTSACNDLAETLRLLKRPQEALPYARQALALDANLSAARDTLANILCDLGNVGEAAREAKQAVEADPRRPDYQHTLLRILIKQGDTDAARRQIQALDKAKTAIPDQLRDEFRKLK